MPKLRLGVIGGGGIASAHLPHLRQRAVEGEIELVGIADVNSAAASTAKKYDVERFVTDYRELLPDVDAVLICVPTHLHAEIAVEALSEGKSVFCEKPMARTLEQADAMCDAAQKSGAALQIGFVRRFDDEWLAWREAVLSDQIGRPVVWRVVASGSGPGAAWFTQDQQGGGPFLDGCIHNFDFALHTFGPAQWVFCHGRTLNKANTAIDTGTATVRFQSGDELMLAWSWGLPKGHCGAYVFEFLGPHGTLTWPRAEEPEATERCFIINRNEVDDGHVEDGQIVRFPIDSLEQGFKRQIDEFIAVAQGRKKPCAGGKESRKSLHLALAVLESARNGQVVPLQSPGSGS